jgi:hypothetical protein
MATVDSINVPSGEIDPGEADNYYQIGRLAVGANYPAEDIKPIKDNAKFYTQENSGGMFFRVYWAYRDSSQAIDIDTI